jgi:nicotinamidase-related amidase
MTSALLVMDVQVGIVERVPEGSTELLDAIGRAATAARSAGIPVVYVRIAFRPNGPEISRRNRSFAALANSGTFAMDDDDAATQVHPAVAPHPEDVVVVKKRVSAFAGSDLDVLLRSLDIDELVLTGIATSGVVLSTLRYAADQDFRLAILRDGCADGDPEVHRVLMEKVFPRQAEVLTTAEWVQRLSRGE